MAKIERLPKQEQWVPYASITISAGEWDALRNALNEWKGFVKTEGTGLSVQHKVAVLNIHTDLVNGV